MKRAISVVLLALFTAAVSGVDEVVVAGQTPSQAQVEAHRQSIAAQLSAIPVGSAIEIEPVKGRKFRALLEGVTADAVSVRLVSGNYTISRTIPLDDIRNVKQVSGAKTLSTGTKVKIGVGVGAAVLVGACAASLEKSAPR